MWNKYKYCDCFLEYTNFKDDPIEYKCSSCNKIYQWKFNEKLKERFFNTCSFSKHDNSLFYYSENVFVHSNIWMIGKGLMKKHFPKKKIHVVR